MPTPTNVFLNWLGCSIVCTPITGSPVTVTLDGILDVDPDFMTELEETRGDNNKFAKQILVTAKHRSITITALDIAKILTVPDDSTCVITINLLDGKNGVTVGGGGLQIVLSNAIRASVDWKSPSGKPGSGSVKFTAFGSSGDTDPLVVTAL